MGPARRQALRVGTWGVLAGTALVYALALNPYLLPETYDNVLYYASGRAIAETGAYTFGGWSVWDWPPGFPAMLAVPAALGWDSVLADKLVVFLSVGLGAVLALALLRREGRPWAKFSVAVALLVPTTFLQGTRVMSDWPFAALGFLFLYLLDRLDRPRAAAWGWALVLGLLLGAATLTRHVGVCLGAALLVQAWNAQRRATGGLRGRLAALGPPTLVAALGAALFGGWRVLTLPYVEANAAWASYQSDLGFLDHLDPLAFARQVWDVTMHGTRVIEALLGPGAAWLASGLAVIATALVVYGGYRQIRSHGLRPSDAYVLATAALIATVEWKHARYLLPIAPFLASYLAWGTERTFAWLQARRHAGARWWSVRGAIALWLLGLIAMDAWLVFRGNQQTHGALTPLLSRSEAEFYRGEWHDLERASAHIRASEADGAVLVVGRDELKYPAFFTRRPIARVPADADPQRLETAALCALAPPYRPGEGLTIFGADGRALAPLWDRPTAPPPPPPGRCALSHVLVEGSPPQLAAIAAALNLGAPEVFGDLRVFALPPAVGRVSARP
jgi:hypothetical protein